MPEYCEKPPVVILAGPTAVGKTALSLALAHRLNAEIISADSMQVYRGMDIGSAKILPEEREGVPHHLLDIRDPQESFDVTDFVAEATLAAREIHTRGNLPLVVGGTGFYLQAFLKAIDFTEGTPDPAFRKELEAYAAREGTEALHKQLAATDPEAAAAIHPNNLKRVIRALEYRRETGQSIAVANAVQRTQASPYAYRYFVLTLPREELYRRIDQRVDAMLEAGLVDEVARLKEAGCARGMTSMQGLGYKETLDYLDGLCTLTELRERICTATRHFAKRQLTWFRREPDVIWIDKSLFANEEEIIETILKEVNTLWKTQNAANAT